MKQKIILFVFILSLPILSYSQGRDIDSPFRFGLQFNPLLTWNQGANGFKPNGIKGGFEYGLNVHYYFFKNVGIESGVYMNHHGAKFNYNRDHIVGADTLKYRYDFNLNNIYVKVPIALRFRTNQIGPVYLFGNFGADFSFLVSSKLKFSGRDLSVQSNVDEPVIYEEGNYRVSTAPIRIGLLVGGGIEYPISGSFSITAGIQYNYGFLNMLKDDFNSKNKKFIPSTGTTSYPYTTQFDREDIRSQYLSLTIGALF